MLRPGFGRAVVGFIIGAIIAFILYGIIRVLLGMSLTAPADTTEAAKFTGSIVVIMVLGGFAGWLWGVGSFSSASHEHDGFEHQRAHAADKPSRAVTVGRAAIRNAPNVIRSILPLIRPLLIALAMCVFVVLIFMILGMLPLFNKPQTYMAQGSAVTPAGSIYLPIGAEGTPVSKTVFFAILVFLILGALGTLAVVIALLMNVLSNQVNAAKKAPNEPPTEQPALFRLIDFVASWVNDMMEGMRHWVTR
ncbi:MAG: hypothetical protein IT324_09500 [Anaerolineae bacterium]|nr:hypothetical protein [Anaerolineae bacterium]